MKADLKSVKKDAHILLNLEMKLMQRLLLDQVLLVNGILRKLVVLKESDSLPAVKVEGDDRQQARGLATLYSHPVWMVRRWTKYFGQDEAIKLMTWNNSYPSFSLRANTGKGLTGADLVSSLKMLKVPHEPSLYLDDFVRLKTGMQNVIQAGLLKEGFCAECGVAVKVVNQAKMEQVVVNGLESQVVVDNTRSSVLFRPDMWRLRFAASSEFM
ncbi:hypothetical protein K7X08_027951 [Anisodus acutangulus]|uniref:Ribosomal RNA small subunit methyltransferase B-like ferredoxin-like domain-containing protein n=1 Tax=Anisodus acutangulus TaxID=402998 RepID=A0A9Q1MU85_9SOLA|nr:hypothetical protein K7X08_027951 [Anisodus acutangulus]